MDNAPSGTSSIIMSDGSWEMDARWALNVAITTGDWKEPLYTWHLLVCVWICGKEKWSIYDVVTIRLINTGPSEWCRFFIFGRNCPFNKVHSVFGTCVLGVRFPEVLNCRNRSRRKVCTPFICPLLGLRYWEWISRIVEYQIRTLPGRRSVLPFQQVSACCGETRYPKCAVLLGLNHWVTMDFWECRDTGTTLEDRMLANFWGFLLANPNCWRWCEFFRRRPLASGWTGTQF